MVLKIGVAYFGVRNPEHVERDLKRMVEAGCNTVLHTFSENDLRYYRETMREIVKSSKELELEVYIDPWGVGGVFGGEAFTQFALENDRARQVLSNGNLALVACPNNQTFKEFIHKWIKVAIEVGADIIFWDEPHFFLPDWYGITADVWACRCEICQDLFYKKYDYPMPEEINLDVECFKDESLFDFLKNMMKVVKSRKVNNALCLLPEWENPGILEQKWDKYASLETLDIFGTDPYWTLAGKEFTDFEFHVQNVKQLADKYRKEPQIWIQAFKIKTGEEENVGRAVEVAYQLGIRNIMAWSYLGTAYMSQIQSERPKVVWQELKKAYLKVRRK